MARRALATFALLSVLQLSLAAAYMHTIALRNAAEEATRARIERLSALARTRDARAPGREPTTSTAVPHAASEAHRQEALALARETEMLGHRNAMLQALRWLQVSLVAAIAIAGAWWALARPHGMAGAARLRCCTDCAALPPAALLAGFRNPGRRSEGAAARRARGRRAAGGTRGAT